MLQDIIVWLSNGGTNSVLHNDQADNINCLLSGTKNFYLVDKVKDYYDFASKWKFLFVFSFSTNHTHHTQFYHLQLQFCLSLNPSCTKGAGWDDPLPNGFLNITLLRTNQMQPKFC